MIAKTFKTSLILAATAALFAACGTPSVSDVGGNNNNNGTPTPTATSTPSNQPSMAVSLANATIDSDIGIKTTDAAVPKIDFTVTPSNGFTGTVTVHVDNVPVGVKIADATVTISDATPATGSLVIDASDFPNVIPGNYTTLSVGATGGSVTATPAALTLNLAATYHIDTKAYPNGTTSARDFWGPDPVDGSMGLILHLGNATSVTVIWKNNDGMNNHEMHRGADDTGMLNPATFPAAADLASNVPSGGTSATVVKVSDANASLLKQGTFPHGNASVAPGNTETRVFTPIDPTAVTVMDFHCHVHNAMPGRITIMP